MSGEASASGKTPGQRNREAFGELGADWFPGVPWERLHPDLRAQWEAGARAVTAPLREALEEMLALWRDDAKYLPTDTRDEMSEHAGVRSCADSLAEFLREHLPPGP